MDIKRTTINNNNETEIKRELKEYGLNLDSHSKNMYHNIKDKITSDIIGTMFINPNSKTTFIEIYEDKKKSCAYKKIGKYLFDKHDIDIEIIESRKKSL